jgi:hypothetical protein
MKARDIDEIVEGDIKRAWEQGCDKGYKAGAKEVIDWLESRPRFGIGVGFSVYFGTDWQAQKEKWLKGEK